MMTDAGFVPEGIFMKRLTHYKRKPPLKKLMAVMIAIMMTCVLCLTSCGQEDSETQDKTAGVDVDAAPVIEGLEYRSSLKLQYAECFGVHYYDDGYQVFTVADGSKYLIVPEGAEVPDVSKDEYTVIKQPADNIYLAATAIMALFTSMDGLDTVKMTSIDADEWSFDEPREYMEAGKIVFAGQYSEPDYELLVDKKCDLAVESTMIEHVPEVKEKIEELGIPVLTDYSSYEPNPLGRAEWIKLYGSLTGRMDEAESFFDDQAERVESLKEAETSGETVAFFYIKSDGKVIVRSSADYIPTMIEMAGGEYIFKDLQDDDKNASMPISMEQFYDTAVDADYIVYNGSVDSSVRTLQDLVNKDPVMEKFKAVKEGNCWCTTASMYQRIDMVADMIGDMNRMLTSDDPEDEEMQFLFKLK